MIVLKILFLLLIYDYFILTKAQLNKCIAPEGDEGLCMNLWECTSRIKYIFSNNQNMVQTYNTVKSVCDYTNSIIKVCCPLSSISNHYPLLQQRKTSNTPCNNNDNGAEDTITQLSFRIDISDFDSDISDQSKDDIDDSSEISSNSSYDDSDDTSAISSYLNNNDSDDIFPNIISSSDTDETTEVLFSSSDSESGEIIQNLSVQSQNTTNNTSEILFTSSDNESISIIPNLSIQSEDTTDDTIAMSSGDNDSINLSIQSEDTTDDTIAMSSSGNDSDEIITKSFISNYNDNNVITDEKLPTPTYNDTDGTTTTPFITNDNDSDNIITKLSITNNKSTEEIIPKSSISSHDDSDEKSSTPSNNNSDDIITKSFISSRNSSNNIITKSANPNDHGTDEIIPKSSKPSFNSSDNIITKSAIPNDDSTDDIIVKSFIPNENDHNSKSEEIENANTSKYDDESSFMNSTTESEMDENESEEDTSTENIGCCVNHSNENLNDSSLEIHSHSNENNEVLKSSKLIKKIKNNIKEMNNHKLKPINDSDIKVAIDSGNQISNNTFIVINMNDKLNIFKNNDSSIFNTQESENDNTSEISDRAVTNLLEKILCPFLYKTCNMDHHQEINDSPKSRTDISSSDQESEEFYYFSLPNPPHCGRNRKHNPLKGDFSWQVLLKEKENKNVKQLCKGTLITRQHIVTTAFCIKNREIESVLIRSQILSAYMTLKIKDIKVHENFIPNQIQNDIALITLNTPIRLEETLPICLEFNSNLIQNLTGLIAYTPGFIKEIYEDAGEPRQKAQQVISLYECVNDLYDSQENFALDESVLCTKSEPLTEDICLGSEGSPLVIRGKSRGRIHYYMIGIISDVNKCEANNQFNIFVDISHHLNWILKNM